MDNRSEIETVLAWHVALNASDVDGLLALSAADVEVGGPRGSGSGAHLLRDWVARAGVRMQPGRIFRRDGSVVVEEAAQWRSDDGSMTASQGVACVFGVRAGHVASVVRYPDVAAALAAGGLEASDEAL